MQIFFLRILWHWIFNENIRDSGNYQQKMMQVFLEKLQTQRKQRFQNSNTQQMKKHTANLVIHQKNRKDVLNSFPNYSEATITYHRFQMTERKRRNVVFIW